MTEAGHWLWHGTSTSADGRLLNRISLEGTEWYAHRIVLELTGDEPVPADMDVVRTCDEPRCVAPEHHVVQERRGPSRKLEDWEVRELRARYRRGWRQVDLAEHYGIAQPCVSFVVNRQTYRYVEDDPTLAKKVPPPPVLAPHVRPPAELVQVRPRRPPRLTDEMVREARRRLAEGETSAEIARALEVPYNVIQRVKAGTSYRGVK